MIPQIRRPATQRSQASQIPAAVHGVNAISGIARMGPEECIYCYNLLAEDFGMEVRDGYVEWANGWVGGPAKTVITFQGNVDADDMLWVANEEGIWNVTAKGTTAPVQELVWPSSGGNAGICSYVNFTNDGNERFLLLCDGQNGYYVWEQATGLWAQGTFSAGDVDVELLDFVMIWKKRVWFIERASANAWYLPTASFSGNATAFNFGDQFRFGGALVSLNNWTLDGGEGIDDYLVALSAAGDVVVYRGTDPSEAADFGVHGSWYVGEVPIGNRIASEFSGELYVISVYGLVAMSQLLNGADSADPNTYVTRKISPYVRQVMDETIKEFGWHIHVHPKQSILYLNSPPRFSKPQLAFTLYLGNMSWSIVRGLNKSHTANWQGEVYWTDLNRNKLYVQAGNVDGVYLDPEVDGQPEAIDWDMLTSYQDLGEPARFKRCQYVRPMFIGQGLPAFQVEAYYDYEIDEQYGYPVIGPSNHSTWGTAVWDVDVWAGGLQTSDNPRGTTGMGRYVAVNIRGRSSTAVTLAAFDIIYDYGGLL